jgi:predicted RNase H-like nuclease (RuvC/YqgF family)|nr:MAG TPA: SECRETED 45 KDA PROTEIN CYCLE, PEPTIDOGLYCAN, CHAP, CELL [Caudoviricetes sp.]
MTKDEIKKGLEFCKADWCVMCPYCNCIGCEGFLKQDALTLITKQEQEIEQLKTELKQLKTNAEILARGVRDLNHENYKLTEKLKQAKIDVLNELREKYSMSGSVGSGWATIVLADNIDEMIEELKK